MENSTPVARKLRHPFEGTWPLFVVALIFSIVLYHNAWLGDDPYITYRSIDNFVNGLGMRWNPAERVQSFTDPLWAAMLTVLYAVTREAFFTTLGASWLIDLGLLFVLFRATRREPWRFGLMSVLLLSSKAFIDYSTSGLENPLSHLLAAMFFAPRIFRLKPGAEDSAPDPVDECRSGLLVAMFAFITRADTILVYAPALAWMGLRALRWSFPKTVRAVAIGALPAIVWHAIAVIYYGFPFPNTAYSKLNGGSIAVPFFHRHSIIYFTNNFVWDPATLVIITAGCLAALLTLRRRHVAFELLTAAGIVLYLLYVVRIGGDYMSGRFFALPFLLGTLLLGKIVPSIPWAGVTVGAAFVLSLLGPRPPVLANWKYDKEQLPIDPTGIRDERGNYHPWSLVRVIENGDYSIGIADAFSSPLRSTNPPVVLWGAIGYYGFKNGPGLHTIDFIGLSDAFIARLPAPDLMQHWGRGHLFRAIPEGYVESVETGDNLIVDPALHELYGDLQLVISGPLFSRARFVAIWNLNTGKYTPALKEYARRLPP